MPKRAGSVIERENEAILALVAQGYSDTDACRMLNLSQRAWEKRISRDPELRARRDAARASGPVLTTKKPPPLEQFRAEYVGHDTPRHQKEWEVAISENQTVLILAPPEHAKTSFVEEYIAHEICRDRFNQVLYASKTQPSARKRLYRVSQLLTDEGFAKRRGLKSIPKDFGPFRPRANETNLTWSKDMIYVSGVDAANRDATLEAVGVGTQIQGNRADIIILDDIATLENQTTPNAVEGMWTWLGQQVLSRLPPDGGKLIIIGTRVNEFDIYSRMLGVESLKDPETGEERPFAKLVQPAILDDEAQEVLWPEMWPYRKLVARRDHPLMNARSWSLTYQQRATGLGDNPFTPEGIERAKGDSEDQYPVGRFAPHMAMVMGVDPALSGTLGMVVVGLDRQTGVRYVIDVEAPRNLYNPGPIRDAVVELASKYGVREVMIEKNAQQGFFSRDEALRYRLAEVDCTVREWMSTEMKHDPEWGISSVADQFDRGIYRIPWKGKPEKIRAFCDELLAFRPQVKGLKKDQVDALWLAELAARQPRPIGPVPGQEGVPDWARRMGPPRWLSRVG